MTTRKALENLENEMDSVSNKLASARLKLRRAEAHIAELETQRTALLAACEKALAILDVVPYAGCVDGNCNCLRCTTNGKLIDAIARARGEAADGV